MSSKNNAVRKPKNDPVMLEKNENMTFETEADKVRRSCCEMFVRNAQEKHGLLEADIPLEFLKVEPKYQRKLDQSHVNNIAANWDWEKCGWISVSYRDGWFWVKDGAHRVSAAKKLGFQDIPCVIKTGGSISDEAHEFIELNKAPYKRTTIFDRFKAGLCEEGDEKDQTIFDVAEICDSMHKKILYTPKREAGAAKLTGLDTAYKICKEHGRECLRWVLETIQKSGWHNNHNAYSRTILLAFKNLYLLHIDELDKIQNKIEGFNRGDQYIPERIIAAAKLEIKFSGAAEAVTKFYEKLFI